MVASTLCITHSFLSFVGEEGGEVVLEVLVAD